MFSESHKRKVREEAFPEELKRIRAAGARLAGG
jgi:hypothetical protein